MRRHAVVPILLAALTGCTSFQGGRAVDALPTPIPAARRIEIWSGGARWQLHAVSIDADSLRGVRWWHSPACDSCRVTLARTAIDSVRTSRYDGGETGVLVLIVTPVVLFFAMAAALSGMD